jgi:O-methyltransferase
MSKTSRWFWVPPGEEAPPFLELMDMTAGFLVARAAMLATGLGLPDHLAGGPRSVEDLAEATGTHAPSLRRLLRVLAAAGLFASDGQDNYRLAPPGEVLTSDHPLTLGSTFRMWNGPMMRLFMGLEHSLRTGEPSDQVVLGAGLFDYFAKHPEEGADFDQAMTDLRRQFTPPILMAYDFSGISRLVDVGGGHGFFLSCVLLSNPSMSGVLFDQPHVVEGGRKAIEESGLSDRCQLVGGDFFASVPEGADAYVLSWIIHDWDEERALAILRNCRKAIVPEGRLLLMEAVIPEGDEPHFAKVLDLFIMTMGGRERTEAEYADLLARGGFRLQRVVPTLAPISVIEAVPVP